VQKIQGDPAALVAATLTQAEMALRAASIGNTDSKLQEIVARMSNPRLIVQDAYEHYLAVVTTGKVPPAAATDES
jgi:hypothetical protein